MIRFVSIAILLGAFGLRVYHLDLRELRSDEAFGYFFSLRSLSEIVQNTIDFQEPHPVASYFVAHGWLQIAGRTIFALRFSSVWFNLLSVALMFRLTVCLGYKRKTAAFAAFLMAISPYAINHSQDARMYSMSLALTIATVWLAIEWLQRQRIQYAIGYILCATLALYTHYYAAYVLLALYVFVLSRALFFPGLQNSVINLLGPLFFISLLYTPWYERAASILSTYQGVGDSPTLWWIFVRSFSAFSFGKVQSSWQQLAAALLMTLSLSLAIIAHLFTGKLFRRTLWLLLLYLVLPLLAIWFDARSRETFSERSIVALLPPFLILIASNGEFLWLATNHLGKSKVKLIYTWRFAQWFAQGAMLTIVMIGIFLSLNNYYYDSRQNSERGWEQLASQMNEVMVGTSSHSVQFIQTSPNPELEYYLKNYQPVDGALLTISLDQADPHDNMQLVHQLLSSDSQRLVIVLQLAQAAEQAAAIQALLGKNFQLNSTQKFKEWLLYIYDRPVQSFAIK